MKLEFVTADTDEKIKQIKTLFLEYQRSLGIDLCFQDFNRELAELPGEYAVPAGRLYLLKYEGKLAGCAALRKMKNGICEMKRLYVKPEYRGLKLGRRAAEQIIRDAGQIGYKTMRLDTLLSMKEAISLYKSLGFREIEPYRFNPVEGTVYMELSLNVSNK